MHPLPGELFDQRQRSDQLRQFGFGPGQLRGVDHIVQLPQQPPFDGRFDARFGLRGRLFGQFGGLADQLGQRQADMAVSDQRIHAEHRRRRQPVDRIGSDAEVPGDLVGL